LREIAHCASAIRSYPRPPPLGQWNWVKDADVAEDYARWITREGWPRDPEAEEAVLRRSLPEDSLYDGFNPHSANPGAGVIFPAPGAR
jgi:hypothetical protein